jgi:hypothetical protein
MFSDTETNEQWRIQIAGCVTSIRNRDKQSLLDGRKERNDSSGTNIEDLYLKSRLCVTAFHGHVSAEPQANKDNESGDK